MAKELVSFDDLKTFLGLEKNESDYPDLTLIQESVVDMFEEHTQRIFEQDTYTRTYDIHSLNTQMIGLEALPILSITSITVEGTILDTTSYKITDYGVRLDNKVQNSQVIITYIGGLDDVPKPITRAALLQTVFEYQNKNSIGLEIVTNDGGSITKPELGMLREVKRLLRNHRHKLLL